jgi:hypothetical protein
VIEIELRTDVQHHVDVRHAEIGIHQQDGLPFLRESQREVHGNIGLADAALAAGDSQYAYAAAGFIHDRN